MKLAVVGCEASGKTVFMSALADYFGRDAANNPVRLKLTPENAAANKFERLMFRQMRCQRQWPPATPPDHTVEVKWALRQNGEELASIDLLEFGGETFRAAFRDDEPSQREGSVAELLKYLGDTDFFIVLVSIKALLADPNGLSETEFERETEALWVTRGILEFIKKNRPSAGIVIGLTQADKYRNELGEAGGPKSFFAERWPTVAAAMGNVPVVDVASVSKTDDEGNPADGYNTRGILPVMRIFAKHCFGDEEALENGKARSSAACNVVAAEPPPFQPMHGCNPDSSKTTEIKMATAGSKGPFAFFALTFVFLAAVASGIYWGVSKYFADGVLLSAHKNDLEPAIVVPVTNTVEKIVEVEKPVTNTVEKIVEVEKPVTNTVEKIVEVEKPVEVKVEVEKIVTNTVEKIVEVEKPVDRVITNVIERVIERPMPVSVPVQTAPAPLTATASNAVKAVEQDIQQSQVPPGFRIWTDYNGRKIIAKWTGVAVDKSGITIITRYDRRIDAVLWKFSAEDQAYIKAEIKRHEDAGEVLSNGSWIKNPMLKK